MFLLQIMTRVFGQGFIWARSGTWYVINPRAVVYKVENVRLGRWDHFKTF